MKPTGALTTSSPRRRLLVLGGEGALAQEIELVLVETSFRDGDILPKNSPLTF
ncbi:MAG TPA: hypothetical protein VHT52_11485 [Stellaceae bacterium]|jgi:hypothetical protein|nr:hypothetical protein [Stellaceae bacterium]